MKNGKKVIVYKYLKFGLMILWVLLFLSGVINAPFAAYEPRTGLSVILLLLSLVIAVVMNVYDVRTQKQTGSLFQRMGIYLVAYLANLSTFVQLFIAMRR